jgi:uncharacterized protein
MVVASPCIAVCTMDMDGDYCKGCRRTLQEITLWPSLNDHEKKAVIAKLSQRKAISSGS